MNLINVTTFGSMFDQAIDRESGKRYQFVNGEWEPTPQTDFEKAMNELNDMFGACV